jgi:hypothetical protein
VDPIRIFLFGLTYKKRGRFFLFWALFLTQSKNINTDLT